MESIERPDVEQWSHLVIDSESVLHCVPVDRRWHWEWNGSEWDHVVEGCELKYEGGC
jgi:hypothetical protein